MPDNSTSPKVTDLIPDSANTNRHTERGTGMTRKSVQKFGPRKPLELDKNGVIIDGNSRQEIYVDVDIDSLEVIDAEPGKVYAVRYPDFDLSDPENPAREYQVAQARAAQLSLEFDPDMMVLHDEQGVEFDDWFFDWEWEELLDDIEQPPMPTGDAEPQTTRADELQKKWQVETGQLWRLPSRVEGQEHRLICGDCTDRGVVEHLMGGDVIDLQLTDPPYGINVVNVGKSGRSRADSGAASPVTAGTIRASGKYPFGGKKKMVTADSGGDHWVDATQYAPVVGDDKPFDPSFLLSLPGEKILFGSNYYASQLPDSRCWIVWDKNNTGNFADAELAWGSFKTGVRLYKFTWNGLVREGERRLEGVRRVHPTQKPVGLFSAILQDFSEEGQIIADFYAGAGVTLLAAENLSRQCRAIEISPAYCAVILQRYKDAFGIEPELIS